MNGRTRTATCTRQSPLVLPPPLPLLRFVVALFAGAEAIKSKRGVLGYAMFNNESTHSSIQRVRRECTSRKRVYERGGGGEGWEERKWELYFLSTVTTAVRASRSKQHNYQIKLGAHFKLPLYPQPANDPMLRTSTTIRRNRESERKNSHAHHQKSQIFQATYKHLG